MYCTYQIICDKQNTKIIPNKLLIRMSKSLVAGNLFGFLLKKHAITKNNKINETMK